MATIAILNGRHFLCMFSGRRQRDNPTLHFCKSEQEARCADSFVLVDKKIAKVPQSMNLQKGIISIMVGWISSLTSQSTIFQISVIFVTAHRCAGGLKKLDLRSGSQRHRHFIGFFKVPVQAPTRGQPFYGYFEKPPHLVAFYDMLGIRMAYSHLKPRGPHGDLKCTL